MNDVIKGLNDFNIDAFRRAAHQYVVVWPRGGIAILDSSEARELLKEVRVGIKWENRTLDQIQEEFFRLHKDQLIPTIY